MLFALAALACFAALDTSAKVVALTLPVLLGLWFRYIFQAVITTAVVLPQRGRSLFHTRRLGAQLLRGVLLTVSSLFTFLSVKYMPLGEFTAIAMVTPLVVTLLAATWLGERVSRLRWLLVSGGFVGTLIIIRPGGELFGWFTLLPLSMVATYSAFQILTSKLVKTEDPVTMHVYTGWAGTVLSSLALPFVWVTPRTATEWTALLLMGLMGTIGHFLLILAYRRTPAATLTPLLYTQIAFAMLAGWIVFSHVPDGWSLLGMTLIAFCGAASAWLALLENRVKQDPLEV
ncbi:MAG: DMT family transporter [Curvibacter sp.]|jgi:drug/metabolite transporter (DMT)-like permease|nr:DMT family transporter [Curvibacter sp.]